MNVGSQKSGGSTAAAFLLFESLVSLTNKFTHQPARLAQGLENSLLSTSVGFVIRGPGVSALDKPL